MYKLQYAARKAQERAEAEGGGNGIGPKSKKTKVKEAEEKFSVEDLMPDCDESVKDECLKYAQMTEDELSREVKAIQKVSVEKEKKAQSAFDKEFLAGCKKLIAPHVQNVVKQIEVLRAKQMAEMKEKSKSVSKSTVMVETCGYDLLGSGATWCGGIQTDFKQESVGLHVAAFGFKKFPENSFCLLEGPLTFNLYKNRDEAEGKFREWVKNQKKGTVVVAVTTDALAKRYCPPVEVYDILADLGLPEEARNVRASVDPMLLTKVDGDVVVEVAGEAGKAGITAGLTIGKINGKPIPSKPGTHAKTPDVMNMLMEESKKSEDKKVNLTLVNNAKSNSYMIGYREPLVFVGRKGASPGEAVWVKPDRDSLARVTVEVCRPTATPSKKEVDTAPGLKTIQSETINFVPLVNQPTQEKLTEECQKLRAEMVRAQSGLGLGGGDGEEDEVENEVLEKEAEKELDQEKLRVLQDDYVVCIPTHQRAKLLEEKTLAELDRLEVPREKVYVCVEKSEMDDYKEVLGDSVNYIEGAKGIRLQRERISGHFDNGTHIISIDDDIRRIRLKVKGGGEASALRDMNPGEFDHLARFAGKLMLEEEAFLWGSSASQNPFNMQNWGVSRRLGLVNGGFHGYINRKPGDYPHLWPKYGSTTEDVERSLRVFNEDRVLLRLKFLTVDTLCYVGAGGLQSFAGNARKARERRQIFALEKMFPEFIKTGDQIYARTVNCKFLHAGKGVRKTEGLPWLGKEEQEPNEVKATVAYKGAEKIEGMIKAEGGSLLSSRR